jgi:hypothetical protein
LVAVNGQPVARIDSAGGVDLEPAVFLPGANEIRLSAGSKAACDRARLAAGGVSLRLTLASLTPAVAAPATSVSPPRPVAQPATPPRPAPARDLGATLRRLPSDPFALTLLAVVAAMVLARVLARGLDGQARRRLDGLAELRA